MTGFETASVATLEAIRDNLRHGLTRVADALADGSFETVGVKGAAPPSQSGQITVALLAGVEAELRRRDRSAMRSELLAMLDLDETLADWAIPNPTKET